jgi:hypothetical protein
MKYGASLLLNIQIIFKWGRRETLQVEDSCEGDLLGEDSDAYVATTRLVLSLQLNSVVLLVLVLVDPFT